ncbi:macrophage mannose receptor 1-like [Poecilia reticulata]|uniref:macrophage mannose receptor 1-like n=1 Tax=Poecilia reticulata TaxID=8081 RepID=UPI0004A4DE52|nr:PREDICTED: macrophage mannose receptor 1-like [Poecilia reticulata]
MGFISGALFSVASTQSHQYYFVNTLLTWTEAQSVCRRDFTDLATIESTADVDDFLNTTSGYTGKAWIGLYDDTINSWKWSLNDSSFYGPGENSFRNWHPGQPDDYYGQQHCVRFYGSSVNSLGQWDDDECMGTRQFVCYNGTVGGSPSYVLSNISLTWTEAQKFCRQNYVDLASVRNQAENEIIRTLVGANIVWIGLYREKLWSDGSTSLFRYWANGKPNGPSGEQCVAGSFSDSGRWSDESCTLSLPFVCFKPIPSNAKGFTTSAQDESSITMQWNKINNSTSFVLLYNGSETFIRAPDGDGPVNYTVSSLTPTTNYTFTLFSVLDNVRSSGIKITAATAPQNAEGFTKSGQYKSSITLQWNKININTSFVLQFNGTETLIRAPDGDGPVNHTVSFLTAGTKYTFTLYSVFENVRSSGVQLVAFLEPRYVSRMKVQLTSQRKLSESEMEEVLAEYLKENGLSQFSMKIRIIKP